MSIRVVCPSCAKVYVLDETKQGKTVLCRACQSPIAIPVLSRQGPREDVGRPPEGRIQSTSRTASPAGRAARDEEGPRRRPAERGPRGEDEDTQGGKNLLPILLGVGGAAIVLFGIVIGGGALLYFSLRGGGKQAAAAQGPPAAPAANLFDPAPGPAAGPVAGPAAPPAVPAAGPPAAPPPGDEVAVPAGPVPAEMKPDVVRKVKYSTAYLRVRRPGGDVAEGSGFFALERGVLITNAHVVGMKRGGGPPLSVDVVVHSGEAGEVKFSGTVRGVDRENDLAVLRVDGDLSRLPPPLAVDSATKLTELQNVYIFGFPFGAQLGKNITVTGSTVGAQRRSGGALKQVQVNGGMNPGNSGGPVADARGVVVGVSVAIITGTQINFAVPADYIRPLVARSKSQPFDLAPPPGPLAGNNPPPRNERPAGPPPVAGAAGDLAALRGVWQSGPVPADDGRATGTVKLSINPNPGGAGGRLRLHIATKQAGRTTNSSSDYSFTLRQNGRERTLVTRVSRRGRGIVLVYHFEGGRLVVSGKVASIRFGYTLQNVDMRRTSAEPEAPPAGNPAPGAPPAPRPGGGGKGSPAALKFSGDVFSFAQEAVRDRRLADVDVRGFTLGKAYRDVCEEGGVLIGFQVGLGKFGTNDIVNALRPIYRTKNGEKFGAWQGPAPAAPITVKAKPGYVVSGLSMRTALAIDGFTVTFTKLGPTGLISGDTYAGDPVGGPGGNPSTAGGNGALFVGVTGHMNGPSPSSLGLVAVLPKN